VRGRDDALRHVIGELVVRKPVLQVPARVLAPVETEGFAAHECDAFCFDFAQRARHRRVRRVLEQHVREFVKERLVRERRHRVNRDIAPRCCVPLDVPVEVIEGHDPDAETGARALFAPRGHADRRVRLAVRLAEHEPSRAIREEHSRRLFRRRRVGEAVVLVQLRGRLQERPHYEHARFHGSVRGPERN
jgi:hypothetical protein